MTWLSPGRRARKPASAVKATNNIGILDMKATLFFGFSLFHVGEFYISVRGVVKRLAGAYRRGSRPSRNGGGLPGGGLRKYADFPRRGKSARSLGLLPRSAFVGSRSMPAAPRYAFLRPTALAPPVHFIYRRWFFSGETTAKMYSAAPPRSNYVRPVGCSASQARRGSSNPPPYILYNLIINRLIRSNDLQLY